MEREMNKRPDLQKKLYARGFFFTDDVVDHLRYPFWGQWKKKTCGNGTLLVSPEQQWHALENENCTMLLIGHAYDPISLVWEEHRILKDLCAFVMQQDWKLFFQKLNQLTGVFTIIWLYGGKVYLVGDATGMQTAFYTVQNGHYYISSHTNMIGDQLSLKWDEYVTRLANYRFFGLLGNALPGDLTQFSNVKRLVPNHYMEITEQAAVAHRFYWPKNLHLSVEEVRDQTARLLHNNLDLITKKWGRPAISMTGGCDSKTTLACAAGVYEKYQYFSYVSSEAERIDAEAAGEICRSLNLPHKIYQIPETDEALPNIEETRKLLFWNTGAIRKNNSNDVRKRHVFADCQDFDVEVKSWVSEVGRAYYSKRFHGRTKFMDGPTPRACTTLYKFFLHNRKLVKDTDAVFQRYLRDFWQQDLEDPVPWQEQFFWEFRVPSWNGLVITGEHRYSFDITIPYNNRILLELMLSVPIEDRIKDRLHREMRECMNPMVDHCGIAVTNLKHTERRARMEDIYWILHSRVPF